MDKSHYSITNFSVLEKIAHVLHMNELWNRAHIHYQALFLQPPSPGMCLCATNTDLNGITQELNLLALKIKYPGITSGEYEKLKEQAKLGYDIDYSYGKLDAPQPPPGYDIDYSYGKTKEPSASFQEKLMGFDFSGTEAEVYNLIYMALKDSGLRWHNFVVFH
jgi:hypothetical protein